MVLYSNEAVNLAVICTQWVVCLSIPVYQNINFSIMHYVECVTVQ